MQLATHLVVNSFAARAEVVKNVGVSPEKVTVVYHGIPQRNDAVQGARIRMALTVGVISRENLLRKGLLPFVQASHLLPDVRFVHAGPVLDDSIKELYRAASTNVEFLGRLSDEDLEALYDRASVYVQASLHEGFGMSVAEAMAAGCIPVVSRHGSLPEVVGDTGVLLSDTTADGVVQGIARALDATDAARFNAQKRVRKLFSLDQREHKLRKVLDHLIETQRN
jgi:glycosyltransferase involved in cell wall biosynthesis